MNRLLLCGASLLALLALDSRAHAATIDDATAQQLRALIEAAQQNPQRKVGSDQQKIADFYASFMDVQRIDSLGYKPLVGELQRIRVLRDRRGLPQVIAHLGQIGVALPYAIAVLPTLPDPVAADAGVYTAHLVAGQLGMPNLAAYQPGNDPALQALRARYARHVEQVLTLGGTRDPAGAARAVLALETAMAQLQAGQSQAQGLATGQAGTGRLVAPNKAAQLLAINKLGALAPGYDWGSALGAAGVSSKTDKVQVDHPSYLAGFAKLAAETDLASWKAYLEWQLLRSYSPYLPTGFARADAAFYGTPPLGLADQRPRWKAGVELAGTLLADLIGKQYVASHFPPERKARIERIAAGQLAACIRPDTDPARPLRAKVGYPAKWPGTSSLTVSPAELLGNVMRARQLGNVRTMARIGSAIERDEWSVPPHSTDIVYDAVRNEIVLPAAVLQAPLVDQQADDAAIAAALSGRIRRACAQPAP